MKNMLRLCASVAVATALFSAVTTAQAQVITVTENFDAATPGMAAGTLFPSSLVVSFAGVNGITNQWEPDLSDPQLTVGSNAGNNVLGLGDGGFSDGPIIFQLIPDTFFDTFSIDVVPGTSADASATAIGYFQTLSGAFDAFTFNVDQTVPGTLNLSLSIPAQTVAIILPGNAQYDNVALQATTVPEAGTLPLALGGFAAIGGMTIARRRRK
ncbi:MAG: hypothetical protein H8F28_24845 [Fibrella sp.]|nr:hypothetical protein [Armatimonadota bacterium]